MADETLDTLIRFRLNVPELKADFNALKRELEFFNSFAVTAGKGVSQSIENARITLGVRAFKDIREEIAGVASAYDTLAKSAKLSGRELEASFVAAQRRIKDLKAELTKNIPRQVDPIAAARNVLGIRSIAAIQGDIDVAKAAYGTLRDSGKLAASEIAVAFDATRAALRRLSAEAAGTKFAEKAKQIVKNVQQDALELSRATLGVRGGTAIAKDIDAVRDAYRNLRASGKLTGQDLETSFLAARKRLRELRDEARGAQFLNQRSGARGPNAPPSQSSFLKDVAGLSFGQLTGAFTAAQLAAEGLAAAIQGLFAALASGVNFLKETEQRAFGIAGILTSLTDIGNAPTEFNQALSISDTIVRRLNDAALATAATSKDLTAAFQGIVGPGLAAQLTLEQIITLSVTGVNAVKSLGLNSTQVVQELRDLVQGGIQPASSTVATALGISDSDVKRLKGNGKEFFDFLIGKLRGFQIASGEFGNTFVGAFEQLKDVFVRLVALASTPIFEGLRRTFVEIVNAAVKIDKATNSAAFNPVFVAAAQEVARFFTAAGAAAKNLGESIATFLPSLASMGGIAVLLAQGFLLVADTVRIIVGVIAGAITLITNGIAGAAQFIDAAGKKTGLIDKNDTSLEEFGRVVGDTADNAANMTLKLLGAKSALSTFNEEMEKTAKSSEKASLGLDGVVAKVDTIIAKGSEVTLPLRGEVNKTAAEIEKLLKQFESLRGRTISSEQLIKIDDQLLIARQALNRSAKEFENILKPLGDVFAGNLKSFVDAIGAIVTGNAAVRNLALDFRKVNIELSGAVNTAERLSRIETSQSLSSLVDAFNKFDVSLQALNDKAVNQSGGVKGSFDAAQLALDRARVEDIARNPKDVLLVNEQARLARRDLAARESKELVEIDRQANIERRQMYEQLFQTTQALAQTALQKYQQYAQQVIQLDRQIANNRLDLQTSDADLRRSGLSNPEQLRSVRAEIKQLTQQTKQALQTGDDQLVQSLVTRRRSLARELLSLGGEQERGNAIKENQAAAEVIIGNLTRQRITAAEARNQQLATFQFLQQTLADIQGKINDISFTGITLQVQVDQSSLQAVIDQIRSAVSNIVATVRVQAVINSPAAAGFAGGGPIRGPGTTTSDSILIAASNKEFMMNAAAVGYWGEGFMHDINNRRVPGFAAGGAIGGGSGTSKESVELTLNIGGGAYRLQGARSQVDGLVAALEQVGRGLN